MSRAVVEHCCYLIAQTLEECKDVRTRALLALWLWLIAHLRQGLRQCCTLRQDTTTGWERRESDPRALCEDTSPGHDSLRCWNSGHLGQSQTGYARPGR